MTFADRNLALQQPLKGNTMENVKVTGLSPAYSVAALNQTLAGKAALAMAASLFVALCAHLVVPLPFTPVPLTLGDFAVLLVGLMLGPVTGFAALTLYLAEGAAGMPVFSPTGPGGIAQLIGTTGGYLMAYPIAAAVAGGLSRTVSRMRSGSVTAFASAITANAAAGAIIMIFGVLWLAFVLHLAPALAFKLGALPFLPGQAIKVLAAAGIATSIHRLRKS